MAGTAATADSCSAPKRCITDARCAPARMDALCAQAQNCPSILAATDCSCTSAKAYCLLPGRCWHLSTLAASFQFSNDRLD